MPRIHVCSLALIGETVEETGARSLVTLLNPGRASSGRSRSRPSATSISPSPTSSRTRRAMSCPADSHVRELLEFVGGWDRAAPLLIHCFAGVSRSTAAAFISACALAPRRDEGEIALALRAASALARPRRPRPPTRASSPSPTPCWGAPAA